jgi:hypothetical protein
MKTLGCLNIAAAGDGRAPLVGIIKTFEKNRSHRKGCRSPKPRGSSPPIFNPSYSFIKPLQGPSGTVFKSGLMSAHSVTPSLKIAISR